MDAKKLMLLKIGAVVIIVFLIAALVMTYLRMPKGEEELKLGKIRNNYTTLVAYGDEKFFFSSELSGERPLFKFVNKNDKAGTLKVIEEYANSYVDSEIIAKDNKLFYYVGQDTYMYDIATGRISLFAQGELQDLTEEWYVALDDGVLYKGIYYHNTMKTKNRFPITSDGEVEFAYEDEENLYYIARSAKNYYALIGLKKSDLTITVYDTVAGYEENIIDVKSNKNYIFEVVKYLKDELVYALRIIPKGDKNNKWDVQLERKENTDSASEYTYALLDREFVDEPKLFDKNIYMLRFKVNESGDVLQDGYMIHDIELDETKLAKPSLTDLCVYEYSAEIRGAQVVIYKQNKEYKKVTLSGQKEGELEITKIYKIDNEIYLKVTLNPAKKHSIYIRINEDGSAEIYG